jgi:protein subunit release factor A
MLVTHLTDLQNTGASYGESARQTLQAWGGLPHLVRAGAATVSISLAEPAAYQVWALSTGGRRVERVPATIVGGALTFTVQVQGSEGARMLYEVVR